MLLAFFRNSEHKRMIFKKKTNLNLSANSTHFNKNDVKWDSK